MEANRSIDAQRLDEVAEGFIKSLKAPDQLEVAPVLGWKSVLLGTLLGLASGVAAFVILSVFAPPGGPEEPA